MSGYEYRCRRCKAKFVEQEARCPGNEPEMRCPMCLSNDIERSRLATKVLDFVRNVMAPT
jgi:DNA-directed RNA polymerase subunit RPC12/RpoP